MRSNTIKCALQLVNMCFYKSITYCVSLPEGLFSAPSAASLMCQQNKTCLLWYNTDQQSSVSYVTPTGCWLKPGRTRMRQRMKGMKMGRPQGQKRLNWAKVKRERDPLPLCRPPIRQCRTLLGVSPILRTLLSRTFCKSLMPLGLYSFSKEYSEGRENPPCYINETDYWRLCWCQCSFSNFWVLQCVAVQCVSWHLVHI